MRVSSTVVLSSVAVALILAALAVALVQPSRHARAQIRTRYQLMRAALTSQDTNAALALVAPAHRGSFDGYRFSMLNDFAQPLGPRSSILVLGEDATVWPERTSHYLILPGGNTIKMVKVDGEWFFTGKVSID